MDILKGNIYKNGQKNSKKSYIYIYRDEGSTGPDPLQ